MKRAVCAAVCLLCSGMPRDALAQWPDGYVSLHVDALPNAPGSPVELRGRLFVDEKLTPFPPLTLRLSGSLDVGVRSEMVSRCSPGVRSDFVRVGVRSEIVSRAAVGVRSEIVSQRPAYADDFRPDPNRTSADEIRPDPCRPPADEIRPDPKLFLQEGYAEIASARADLRLGYSRVVWGRLDEVQPTDVVNPLDLGRFFFEGRSEARIAVPMARGRVFFGEDANVDALLVPVFRRGRFDQLDEPTSPFNVEPATVAIIRREPAVALRNLQGGARLSATMGRVDWSVSAFRGFDAFGTYVPQPATASVLQVFPRRTMIGGDFETATGEWAFRGEFAYFSGEPDTSEGGVGFDRRAGQYHVSATMLAHHEPDYTSASLVAAADRTFARERYRTRAFGVYNITERATFLRSITSMELRANLTLEGSIGWFFGSGAPSRRDLIGRFSDRDFLYARLKLHF